MIRCLGSRWPPASYIYECMRARIRMICMDTSDTWWNKYVWWGGEGAPKGRGHWVLGVGCACCVLGCVGYWRVGTPRWWRKHVFKFVWWCDISRSANEQRGREHVSTQQYSREGQVSPAPSCKRLLASRTRVNLEYNIPSPNRFFFQQRFLVFFRHLYSVSFHNSRFLLSFWSSFSGILLLFFFTLNYRIDFQWYRLVSLCYRKTTRDPARWHFRCVGISLAFHLRAFIFVCCFSLISQSATTYSVSLLGLGIRTSGP